MNVGRLLKRLDELGLREKYPHRLFKRSRPSPHLRSRLATGQAPDRTQKAAAKEGGDVNAMRLNAMGFAGPFRGGKHDQYEGGIRIPFIVRWPGHVPAGRVDEQSVISGADWLPTLCA